MANTNRRSSVPFLAAVSAAALMAGRLEPRLEYE
jgi:hypothetical protein